MIPLDSIIARDIGAILVQGPIVDWLLGDWGGLSVIPGIILKNSHCGMCVIWHEMAHQDQMRRLGTVGYWITYLYQLVRYGYANMPLEIEACG